MLHPTTVGRNALAGAANYFLFGWVGSLSWTRIVFWRRFVQFKVSIQLSMKVRAVRTFLLGPRGMP